MRFDNAIQSVPIEGYFRHSKRSSVGMILSVTAVVVGGALVVVAMVNQQYPIAVAAMVAVSAVGMLSLRRQRRQQVKVSFADDKLTIKGSGYHIQMKAPFRYQTGVQRVRASRRAPEFYYVRLVLDVYGKPLVFEEQVPSGVQPPQLHEIVGLSSALGIAELSGVKPYPGTLWSMIQGFEASSAQSERAQIERDIEHLYRIGGQQLNSDGYYAAIQTFSEIIRLTPDVPYPYYNRGMAYFYYGDHYDKAHRDLTTVIRLKPTFDKAYRMRGLVSAEQGDWAAMRDDLAEAIRLNPNDSELYNMRGGACYRLQDYETALSDFDHAIQLGGTNPEPYHNRGLVKHQLGVLDEAMSDFRHALQLNPAFTPAQESLTLIEREKQQQASTE